MGGRGNEQRERGGGEKWKKKGRRVTGRDRREIVKEVKGEGMKRRGKEKDDQREWCEMFCRVQKNFSPL